MRLWQWVKRVIADRGEEAPVPVFLERTPDHGYAFRLGLRAGFGGQDIARVPVHRVTNPAPHPILKEIHECEVAGQTLSAANPFALRNKVGRALETLAPGRALPLCFFRVPRMDYELPVYEDGGHISSPVLGGPKLKAADLAGIRRTVCQYLVSAGYVGSPDEVEVGVVRPRDLKRVAPAAVFRSTTDPELWLPSVEGVSPEGPVVGLLERAPQLRRRERRRAGAGPRERHGPAAPDVVALLRVIRTELQRTRGTTDPAAVYADEVRPDIWAAAEVRSEDEGVTLVAYLSDEEATKLELTVRRTGAGDVTTALEDRGISVFLAPDESALADEIGAYLARHDFLRFATEVEVHRAAPPRAERLEAGEIWTHDEEVSAQWS